MASEIAQQIAFNIRQRQLNRVSASMRKVKTWRGRIGQIDEQETAPLPEPSNQPKTPNKGNSQRNSVFVNLPQPEPKKFSERKRPRPTVNEAQDRKAGKDHHRKAAFASMAELKRKHRETDVDALWETFKAEYGGVDSRSKFSEREWALCAARINCLIHNPQLIGATA